MATPDEELSQIEKDIRTLKIEYEQFFGGGRSRPPTDTQWRVEVMIKRYTERSAELTSGQRFRYTNLASTYAKYLDMWRKKLKQKEEGAVQRHFGAAAKAIEAERERARQQAEAGAESGSRSFAMSFSEPEKEGEKIAELYRKLLETREQAGEKTGAPTLGDFEKFVRQKTQELKKKKGCEQVEYRVSIENGHVKLKARVSE
jgi:hypothetical protein